MHDQQKRFSIGVDLGGTNLRVASYAEGTEFLDSILLPTQLAEGRQRVITDICDSVHALMERSRRMRFAGLGVGLPGPLELPEGILRNPPNLPGWDNFHVRHALESALGFEIELESDANVAALAESVLGAGSTHGVRSLCVLTLGTGVGNGLVLDGSIWHGSVGMGGEAGHIVVQPSGGAACGCGGRGCLEQYASAMAVVRMAKERMGTDAPKTSHEVALLARAGDARAQSVFVTVGEALALGLTALINTLNLPCYLLGGGVCEAWDQFAPVMLRDLRERCYIYRLTEPKFSEPAPMERHKTYVLRAELGSGAGLLGACLLPLQKFDRRPVTVEDSVTLRRARAGQALTP